MSLKKLLNQISETFFIIQITNISKFIIIFMPPKKKKNFKQQQKQKNQSSRIYYEQKKPKQNVNQQRYRPKHQSFGAFENIPEAKEKQQEKKYVPKVFTQKKETQKNYQKDYYSKDNQKKYNKPNIPNNNKDIHNVPPHNNQNSQRPKKKYKQKVESDVTPLNNPKIYKEIIQQMPFEKKKYVEIKQKQINEKKQVQKVESDITPLINPKIYKEIIQQMPLEKKQYVEIKKIQQTKQIKEKKQIKEIYQIKEKKNDENIIINIIPKSRNSQIIQAPSSSKMQIIEEVVLSEESLRSESSNNQQSNEEQIVDSLRQIQLIFESEGFLPSQQKQKLIVVVQDQHGPDIQRYLKQQIKKQYQKRQKIETISQLFLDINLFYPNIILKFNINQKQFTINLLEFFKNIKQDNSNEKNSEETLKKIFYKAYKEIRLEQMSKLYCFIQKRIKLIEATSCITYNHKQEVVIKSLISCCKIYQQKINFLFMGYDFRQIRFSHIFIENHKSISQSSYEYYQKKIKSRIDEGGNVNNEKKKKQKQKLKFEDEEISSDEDKKHKQHYSIKNIKKNLQQILNQNQQQIQKEIEKKQERYEQLLGKNNEEQDQNQKAKIMEEILEASETLEDYKDQKQLIKNEYLLIKQDNKKQNKIMLLYKKLRILRNQLKSKLPIIARKKQLIRLLNKQNLIILQGETGSGKSTQLPQILCQYYNAFQDQTVKPILLTQPRKIATRSIAQRVAEEMGEKINGFVDYLASSNKKVNPDSKIIFMLDRLLLDQLQKDPLLTNYSCLVIDEAHQRTISIDVIIGFVKNILNNRKNFKVIITSATLDAGLFQKYFKAKTFKVSGRLYPVEIQYKPYDKIQEAVQKIYKCVMEEILVDANKIKSKYQGHVLIFCPTIDQINRLCSKFNNELNKNSFLICPLHGKLSIQQQKLVFIQEKRTKIILTSRIAQTAVTIDKVKVVIDLGWDRQNIYNPVKKISEFKLCPISRSAAKQRAGRAGRTTNGYCFRLYSPFFQKNQMKANKKPEIDSLPLDILVLRLKQLQIKDILKFEYLSKPNQQSLKVSLESMQMIGCLDDKYQITQIGKSLVHIPIQPFLSRAIIEAIMIEQITRSPNIADKVIKILCVIVNNQSLFYSNEFTREECQKNKFQQFSDEKGDFFSLLNIFQDYQKQSYDRRKIFKWCKNNFLSPKALYQIQDLYKQVKGLVKNIHIDFKKYPETKKQLKQKVKYFQNNKDIILSCLLTSFCQNLCLYSGNVIVGYTLLSQKLPLNIYGTSFLALQGITPKWIVCYDIISTSQVYCRIAQQVNFQLLKNSISPLIFEKYKLKQYEHSNPFYQVIIRELPTIILDQFSKKLQIQDQTTKFLTNVKSIINKERNKVEIFYEINNKQNLNLQKKIGQFINNLHRDKQNRYIHHYRGTISAVFKSGCQIDNLNLQTKGFVIKLFGIPVEYQSDLYQFYRTIADQIECVRTNMTLCFSNNQLYQALKNQFKNYLQEYPQLKQVKLITQKTKRKEKIMSVCIKLSFFCSQRPEDKLYLNYNHKYLQSISHTKEKQFNNQVDNIFQMNIIQPITNYFQGKFRVASTKKMDGILLFYNYNYQLDDIKRAIGGRYTKRRRQNVEEKNIVDEVEIIQELKKLWKKDSLFYMPKFASMMREIQTNKSNKPLYQWQKQIKILFPDAIDVQVKGFIHPKLFRENYYTSFSATFNLQNAAIAQQYKKKYDKKRDVIGTQKLHIQLLYKQTITRVSQQVYHVFRRQYERKKEFFKNMYYSLYFIERVKKFKYSQYIYIQCVSEKPQQLIQPAKQIDNLYKPHIIPLQSYMKIILQKKHNNKIFQKLEQWYDYEIYFEFQKFSDHIKLYCEKSLFQRIEDDFKREMGKFKDISIKVSYKGKNLNNALNILRDIKNIQYEVIFKDKLLIISGDEAYVSQVQNQIEKLAKNQQGDCSICQTVLSAAYRLYNCSHSFCRFCIVEKILQWKRQYRMNRPLRCPFYEIKNGKQVFCRENISMHDLKFLFEQQQFNDICDIAIVNLVDQKKYHTCFTQNCQQIFQVAVSKKQNVIHCKICNKKYCYKCRQVSHNQQGICNNQVQIKQCKKCKSIITRTNSDHIICSKCRIHICWPCQRIYNRDSDYEQHYKSVHHD